MPNSDFTVRQLSLAFAKIVANPTSNSWSQVYNAGSFFAALSLTCSDQNDDEEVNLPAAGREILKNLEAEFFSLEDKNLSTIKAAIEKSFSGVNPEITADASLCFFKEDVLYVFIWGRGKVILRRGGATGVILDKKSTDPQSITASGYLKNGDIILLQTDNFANGLTDNNLKEAFELELPNDIAESLSTHVHEKEDGGQAGIVIVYKGAVKTATAVPEEGIPVQNEMITGKEIVKQEMRERRPKFNFKLRVPFSRLTLVQKLSAILGILLLAGLAFGVFYTKTAQENTRFENLYKQVTSDARRNIDEGKTMSKLNQSLARDSFKKAEQIITESLGRFKDGSKEQAGLKSLMSEVEKELDTSGTTNKIQAKEVNQGELSLLNIEKNNKALAYSQDGDFIYLLTARGVSSIDKTSGTKKEIIKNNGDWTAAVAVSPYQGNIYILDTKAGVLKYVASEGGFGKTEYFKKTPANLSRSKAMSIDGSIWILTSDGKVNKYTSGSADDFEITGLDKPLSTPTKIFTDIDTDNIYILDSGNSRIVKLSKNGAFVSQFSADVLKDARDFEVLESDLKALALSGAKAYEIPLK